MSTLGVVYSKLGRHSDALALREKNLEVKRRLLPESNSEIGARDF
jgi:hypothetical protein